jgi:hypothetical protein
MNVEFDPIAILEALDRHGVDYVVIGGLAATLLGSPMHTNDLDICYKRDRANFVKLAAALRDLSARPRGIPDELPFVLDDHTLRNGDLFTLQTPFGAFDCLGTPSGTSGYAQLAAAATNAPISATLTVPICSIDDLIVMKRTAGRPKDLIAIEHLEAIKDLARESQ